MNSNQDRNRSDDSAVNRRQDQTVRWTGAGTRDRGQMTEDRDRWRGPDCRNTRDQTDTATDIMLYTAVQPDQITGPWPDTDTCTARPYSRTRWQNIWGPYQDTQQTATDNRTRNRQQHQTKPQTSDRNSTTVSYQTVRTWTETCKPGPWNRNTGGDWPKETAFPIGGFVCM